MERRGLDPVPCLLHVACLFGFSCSITFIPVGAMGVALKLYATNSRAYANNPGFSVKSVRYLG